jgi:hypothetical protein
MVKAEAIWSVVAGREYAIDAFHDEKPSPEVVVHSMKASTMNSININIE